MNEYYCKYCNQNKSENEFFKSKYHKNGIQYKCKECEKKYKQNNRERVNERHRGYRKKNKEKINESLRIWRNEHSEEIKQKQRENYEKNKEKRRKRQVERYHENPEKERERVRKYREKNKESLRLKRIEKYKNDPTEKNKKREYIIKNKERIHQQQKQYRLNNIEKYRKYQREYVKEKRKTNPHYNMAHRLRNRLLGALKEGKGTKQCGLLELMDCSLEFLKNHIESQFTEGMTWQKYFDGLIEIDHIKPCCSFDLSIFEEQKKCFHYTNLCPLWWEDNRKKSEKDRKLKFKKL